MPLEAVRTEELGVWTRRALRLAISAMAGAAIACLLYAAELWLTHHNGQPAPPSPESPIRYFPRIARSFGVGLLGAIAALALPRGRAMLRLVGAALLVAVAVSAAVAVIAP